MGGQSYPAVTGDSHCQVKVQSCRATLLSYPYRLDGLEVPGQLRNQVLTLTEILGSPLASPIHLVAASQSDR